MKKNILSNRLLKIVGLLLLIGCNPDFLDIQRNKAQAIPQKLSDFKSLLDDQARINSAAGYSLGTMASDEYYLLDETWALLNTQEQKNSYIWAKDIFELGESKDWNTPYRRILYTNIVLEGLEKIDITDVELEEFNHIKGAALFLRGLSFYTLAQLFSPILEDKKLEQFGIPLRLESDPTLISSRATVTEVYDQIFKDINASVEYLSNDFTINTRPTKRAAYALLSRAYLQIKNYEQALKFSEQALSLNDELLDYNLVDSAKKYPFPTYGSQNPEVIFLETSNSQNMFSASRLRIDTLLLNSFEADDLRSSLFFLKNNDESYTFRGSYYGAASLFSGLANDELYLNKAEAQIRLGNIQNGLNALNDLLVKRYRTSKFVPYVDLDYNEALTLVLNERRKQLLLRGIRWADLRRLNTEKSTEKTLKRRLNGKVYELLPNDSKYTFPVPENVIINSNVKQYPRE